MTVSSYIKHIMLITYIINTIICLLDICKIGPVCRLYSFDPVLQRHSRIRIFFYISLQRFLCNNPHDKSISVQHCKFTNNIPNLQIHNYRYSHFNWENKENHITPQIKTK